MRSPNRPPSSSMISGGNSAMERVRPVRSASISRTPTSSQVNRNPCRLIPPIHRLEPAKYQG